MRESRINHHLLATVCMLVCFAGCGETPREVKEAGELDAALTDEFTLRMIVYGLHAWVPEDTNADTIFDKISVLPVTAPDHATRLAMTDGTCISGNLCNIGYSTFGMDWNLSEGKQLHDHSLSFGGAAITAPAVMTHGLRTPSPPASYFPSGAGPWGWQWVGWLDHAESSQQLAKKDCKTPWSCESNAILTFDWLNRFGTCHLAHQETDGKDYLSTFKFDGHPDSSARAIADAIIVEIAMKGTTLDVTATDEMGVETTVQLLPDTCTGGGKCVSLIFSNNDYSNSPSGPDHHHFKYYYKLTGGVGRILKYVFEDATPREPGTCETEIQSFETKIGAPSGSHNQRECDSSAASGWTP